MGPVATGLDEEPLRPHSVRRYRGDGLGRESKLSAETELRRTSCRCLNVRGR
jgi:hypothetical protein